MSGSAAAYCLGNVELQCSFAVIQDGEGGLIGRGCDQFMVVLSKARK